MTISITGMFFLQLITIVSYLAEFSNFIINRILSNISNLQCSMVTMFNQLVTSHCDTCDRFDLYDLSDRLGAEAMEASGTE